MSKADEARKQQRREDEKIKRRKYLILPADDKTRAELERWFDYCICIPAAEITLRQMDLREIHNFARIKKEETVFLRQHVSDRGTVVSSHHVIYVHPSRFCSRY